MSRGSSARGRRVARRAAERTAAGEEMARGAAVTENPHLGKEEYAAIMAAATAPAFAEILAGLGPRDRAERVRAALVAAGVERQPAPVQTNYELTNGSLAEREYLGQVILAGYNETRSGSWPSEGALGDHGEVLYREQNAGVFRLGDGTLALVSIAHGWCRINVASAGREECAAAIAAFSQAYPPLYRDVTDDDTVPITFWTNGKWGPTSRLRMIGSADWAAIDGNYTAGVREELGRLMDGFEPGKDGQLLLWQGLPGTGKTWALRALASEWRSWAEFNYITDPDSFFVGDPSYMIDVLLHESYEELTVDGDVLTSQDPGGKWRVLILEDTGELLSANAKESYGQGLSRLLNVVDGMVGQGLRVLAIVTTNDELGDLHPAVTRPGRCASQVEFGPLSEEEAQGWLLARREGVGRHQPPPDGPQTLAELYQLAGDADQAEFADGVQECECGHMADMHPGGGACSMEGCGCDSMDTAAIEADVAEDATELTAAAMRLYSNGIIPATSMWSAPSSATSAGSSNNTTFTLTFTDGIDDTAPPHRPDPPVRAPEALAPGSSIRWTAVLAPEGQATDDGRVFAPGSISWRELPLTLMGMVETQEGHDGAQVCGRIDEIWRDDQSGLIMGAGEFDTGEFGSEIARLVSDGTLRGVSVDIAVAEMEIAYRDEVIDEEGAWRADPAVAEEQEGEPSLLDVLFGGDAPTVFVVRKGIIGAATVCPFPAFAQAQIEVAASLVAAGAPNVWTATGPAGWRVTPQTPAGSAQDGPGRPESPGGGDSPAPRDLDGRDALTASAAGLAPDDPPAAWFQDPELEQLTALTVDDDGRIYGHAAAWNTCHIGLPGVCTTAPYSETNYAYFLLKEVLCDDGERVPCGTITLDTGHAGQQLGRAQAAAHYDDTGAAVADVTVGEDEHGIWVAGALRGDCDADLARKLRGSALSGDWRDVNGNLELVALLAVNVPGFPVPRTNAALVAAGDGFRVTALVAAGITTEEVADARHAELEAAAAAFAEIAAIAEPESEEDPS